MIIAPWPAPQAVTYPDVTVGDLQEATDEEVAAYHERLRDILRSSDDLTGEALERTRDLVNELQDRVLGQMERVRASDRFRAFWLPWMQHAVGQVSADFAERYGHQIEGFLPRAWELGHRTVDATLALPDAMPVLTMSQVGISAQLHPELITGLDEETRRIIGREIAIAVNTGESTHDAMRRLVLPLENQESPFRQVAYRAEVVARTEMARHEDLAAAARMEQSQQLYPEREQWWTILVAEVNGWPCKHCSAIAADGPWRVGDPRGPLLPLHPNCRCKRVGYRPRVDNVNVPTTAEREASVADSQAPSEQPTQDETSHDPGPAPNSSGEHPHGKGPLPETETVDADEFDGPGAASKRNRKLPPNEPMFSVPENYRQFTTADEMEPWVDEHADDWTHSLSDDELDASRKWKGQRDPRYPKVPFDRAFDAVTRGRSRSDVPQAMLSEAASLVEHLDSAISKGTLKEDVVAYRALRFDGELSVGATLDDDGYKGVSLSRAKAEQYAKRYGTAGYVAEVLIPKGTPVGHVDRLGFFEGQLELLLGRNTNLKVTSVEGRKVQVQAVPWQETRE